MSMNKRLQVPMTKEDEKLIKSAAKIYDISASEWARRILRKAAERDTAADLVIDPLEAVNRMSKMSAPIDSVKKMKAQSLKGRLK